MVDINKKREKEKKTLRVMIGVYCRGKHKHKGELCPECQKLLDYALLRTEKCPFMETKTFCSACKVHCYSKEMQEKIKEVMKYAGPRMLFYHPLQALDHMWVTMKGKMKKSGFLIRPTGEMMAVIVMHKLSAVIFCVLGIAHAVQYKTKKRRGKQYVS